LQTLARANGVMKDTRNDMEDHDRKKQFSFQNKSISFPPALVLQLH
jgi:hypothetical protein